MLDKCYFCDFPVTPFQGWSRSLVIECRVCGKYHPFEWVMMQRHQDIPSFEQSRHLYSGAIRELFEESGRTVDVTSFEELLSSVTVPKTAVERIDKILLHIARKTADASEGIEFMNADASVAYCKSVSEFQFYVDSATKLGWIDEDGADEFIRLTIVGWQRVDEINNNRRQSTQAFVAMSFNPELFYVFEEGFAPALRSTGYNPIRVDTEMSHDKIDDKIIADIRKSGLLVADFTENKGGVYFEAGFALGLSIPVIWTCRTADMKNLHFDTNHYPHIDWSDVEDLKSRLINRIEATLPNRPRLGTGG